MMVFQKAWRKGRKRPGGSERRRDARDLERRCWGMGRSVWKMPVPVRLVSVVGAGGPVEGERTEEEAFPDLEKLDGDEGTAGAEVGL